MKNLYKIIFNFLLLPITVYGLRITAFAQGAIGPIAPPLNNNLFNTPYGGGLFIFISNLFLLAGTIAGLFFIFQIISAGFQYMSANGDVKKVEASTNKITQSALGMVIVASAFVLASLVERFTGLKILAPILYGPQ